MWNVLANVIVSIATSIAGAWGVYHYAPLSFLESGAAPKQEMFGTTAITTINGSDTLSASRTTLNNNFASLNTNKVEISDLASTTTLPNLSTLLGLTTIGTIGTGIWQGTAVGVTYGGTGTTSPTLNQIMFGNAASGFKVIGFGSSGQSLVSNGAAVVPSWQSVGLDQTVNYNFTGSSFGVKNLVASSTAANPITLNTLAYDTPSVRAASSTVLSEDGNGHLTWNAQDWQLLSSTTTVNAMTAATSTFAAVTNLRVFIYLQGNSSAASAMYVNFNGDGGSGSGGTTNYGYQFSGYTSVTASAAPGINLTTGTTSPARIELGISNIAASRKFVQFTNLFTNSGSNAPQRLDGSGVWNNTANQITSLNIGETGGATITSGTRIDVYGSRN